MNSRMHIAHGRAWVVAILFLVSTPLHLRAVQPLSLAGKPTQMGRWHDSTLTEYRDHLQSLAALVDTCAKARDSKSCDALQVGLDDHVQLGNGAAAPRRLVRYGWLRVLLSKAQEPDASDAAKTKASAKNSDPASTQPPQPTTTQLLQDAKVRLQEDLAQLNLPPSAQPSHASERNALKQVLAGRDFRGLQENSVRQSMLEKFSNWLNHLFANATRWRSRSAWLGRLIVWGFIAGVCVALLWWLLQMERRWRVRLVPDDRRPAPEAPNARDWQLWLDDARAAAAAGHWREAIHFVYWAAISRLESRRLWPADRARTPREYLALVAADDPRHTGLTALTGSFERTWYGGRAADETQYRVAEELAESLIGGGAAGHATGQGGSR